MLFQILCTLIASVAIVDSENLYFWPQIIHSFWHFGKWLNHIQNNCDSILICFSDESHMGICSKRTNDSKFFTGCL